MRRIAALLIALIALLSAACAGKPTGQSADYPQRSTAADAPSAAPVDAPEEPAAWEEAAPGDGAGQAAPGLPPPATAPAPTTDDAEIAPEQSAGSAGTGPVYKRAPRPNPERPGLATRWGEYRQSHVSTAPFFRADPTRPFASVRIFYNDSAGVRAMAARSSMADYGDNLYVAAQRQLSVRILDGSHRPLRGTRAGGREYVIGEHGQRYIIQIRNHTGNRVEAVASVDGLDVIDGRSGSFRKRGYIVRPFSTLEIEGFRRSRSAVATFRFGSVSDSYAARKGNARNVGVIGVAFFQEAGSRWPWTDEEVELRHDADPFPGRYADPPPVW